MGIELHTLAQGAAGRAALRAVGDAVYAVPSPLAWAPETRALLAHGAETGSTRVLQAGYIPELDVVQVTLSDDAGRTLKAVRKGVQCETLGDGIVARLVAGTSIEHIVAPRVRRSDGTLYSAYVEGQTLAQAGIRTFEDLDDALRGAYLTTSSEDEVLAAARAHLSLEESALLDYAIADSDSGGANNMLHRVGELQSLDHAMAGQGQEMAGWGGFPATLPMIQGRMHPFDRTRVISDPDGDAVIRRSVLSDQALHGAEQLLERVDAAYRDEASGPAATSTSERMLPPMLDAYLQSPAAAEGARARLQHVVDHGWYEFIDAAPLTASGR